MPAWHKFVLLYLWVAPHLFLAAVPIVMYVRNLHKSFPLFFAYTIYETAVFLVLFPLRTFFPSQVLLYRNAFIITLAGSTLLRFGIIQELFNNMFRDYPRLAGLARSSMRWLTGLLLLGAVIAAMDAPGTITDNLLAGLALLDRSIAIIQVGLLLFLLTFSHLFGLSWRSFLAGIAVGFGVVASAELAVSAMRMTELSEHTKTLLDLVPTGGFHVAVVIWIVYLMAADKSFNTAPDQIPEIHQWRGELERRPQ